jgi:hypothetical protein
VLPDDIIENEPDDFVNVNIPVIGEIDIVISVIELFVICVVISVINDVAL